MYILDYMYILTKHSEAVWGLSVLSGPEEELPRRMEYLEFVCHAPSEYFKSRSSPFPTIPIRPEKGYVWSHIGGAQAHTVKESVSGSI